MMINNDDPMIIRLGVLSFLLFYLVVTIGRYAIMIYLGAMFGSVTMSRLTYIIGRVEPLVEFFMMLFGFK